MIEREEIHVVAIWDDNRTIAKRLEEDDHEVFFCQTVQEFLQKLPLSEYGMICARPGSVRRLWAYRSLREQGILLHIPILLRLECGHRFDIDKLNLPLADRDNIIFAPTPSGAWYSNTPLFSPEELAEWQGHH